MIYLIMVEDVLGDVFTSEIEGGYYKSRQKAEDTAYLLNLFTWQRHGSKTFEQWMDNAYALPKYKVEAVSAANE